MPASGRTLTVRLGLFMAGSGGLRDGQPVRLGSGLMGEDRCALEQQAQRLPVDGEQGVGGNPGEAEQVAVHRAASQRLALQTEGGVKQLLLALPSSEESRGGNKGVH